MSLTLAILTGMLMGVVFGFALEKSRVFEPGMIVGQMPSPNVTPMPRPKTSPITQPVRQWIVACADVLNAPPLPR